MSGSLGLLAALAILLLASGGGATPAHYAPHVGDGFAYTETVTVNGGLGNYTGYTEATYVNGSIELDAVATNGTVQAGYQYDGHYVNNSRGNYNYTASGSFYFDAENFSYLFNTTDNQSGYVRPAVWFWANNTLGVGGQFYDLDTLMTVTATSASYHLGTTAGNYVRAIVATGSGAYFRNDSYGRFNASYQWTSYYDPTTGYILGYLYTETDRDGSGNGFSYTDRLAVTETTYALTNTSAPATTSSVSPLDLVIVAVLVVVLIAIVVALALRARRGPTLPKHSATGAPSFVAPPPGPGAAPVRLTPSGEPAVQQIVVRETIKVKCAYCGGLIDASATQCPFCGAARN